MEKKKMKNKVTYKTEEQQEIMKFIILIVIIAVCVGGIYLFTKVFVTKDINKNENATEEVVTGAINYNVTIIGSLLDRPYNEYYVMAYNSKDVVSMKYQAIYSAYMSKEEKDLTKLYYVDLSNIMNEQYVASEDQETNPNAEKIEELKLGEFTLMKIKKGKIVKYIEDIEEIKKELKIGKE